MNSWTSTIVAQKLPRNHDEVKTAVRQKHDSLASWSKRFCDFLQNKEVNGIKESRSFKPEL